MPIDLRTIAGDLYKLAFDPAYEPRGKAREQPDLWMLVIPCQYATIYPAGDNSLRVDIDGHNQIARRVAGLPGCVLVQDGDFEKTIEFPPAMFPAVAEIVKPRRRYRKRTAEERAKLLAWQRRFPVQVARKNSGIRPKDAS
jgi:hypothetical protein